MGQQISQPIPNNLTHTLHTLYQPHIQDHRLPGQPQLLKLTQTPTFLLKSQPPSQLDLFIERYQLELFLSQPQFLQQQQTYSQRKHCLPWHIKVLSYQLQKDKCHCANNKYYCTVYTEHVETRLSNFKVLSYDERLDMDRQFMDSFSISQGIYVLINALQGYQMLMEQFMVNYPTPHSIGITRKGQVKLWICDNWGNNQQNNRAITQNALIEEIINLIDQRTRGSLTKLLNSQYDYLSFTFNSLQEMLAEYTIHFSQGRRTLESRISRKIGETNNVERQSRKFPLSKSSMERNVYPLEKRKRSFSFKESAKKDQISVLTTDRKMPFNSERRAQSHQIPNHHKYPREGTTIPTTTFSNIAYTPRTTVYESPKTTFYESPKKPVKFIYDQPRQSQGQPSPKLSVPTYASTQIPQNLQFRKPNFNYSLSQAKTNSLPIIQRESPRAQFNYSHQQFQMHDQPVFINQYGSKPLSLSSKSSKATSPKLGLEAMIFNSSIQRVQSADVVKNTEELDRYRQVPKIVQFQLPMTPQSPQRIPSQPQSLSQITNEFRSLLKSQQKITPEEQIDSHPYLSSYDQVPLSIQNSQQSQRVIPQPLMYNQKSQDVIPSYLQIHFESIKQVDEDVSFYSVDQSK